MASILRATLRPTLASAARRPAMINVLQPAMAVRAISTFAPLQSKDLQSAYPDNGFDCADDLDQATGLQHAELVADLQGKPFFQESLISGPFGTVDNPVKIESTIGYRIVGCTGGEAPNDHDVAWFELHSGRPLVCDVCGQYFELIDTKPPTVAWE